MYPLKCFPLRLHPGQELQSALLEQVKALGLKAAFILTCVGSVTKARLRMANANKITDFTGPFEIVSLVGTLSGDSGHLHASLSDAEGHVFGGHVIGGMVIFTTAEVVIGECCGAEFSREMDKKSGYCELVVRQDTAL